MNPTPNEKKMDEMSIPYACAVVAPTSMIVINLKKDKTLGCAKKKKKN